MTTYVHFPGGKIASGGNDESARTRRDRKTSERTYTRRQAYLYLRLADLVILTQINIAVQMIIITNRDGGRREPKSIGEGDKYYESIGFSRKRRYPL